MPRWLTSLIVGAAVGLLGVLLGLSPLGTKFEERVGLDWLFSVRGVIDPPPDVVVVAINEGAATALKLPSHPRYWPRSTHARLIESLVKRGASVIVFDLDFQRPKSRNDDLEFAEAVAKSKRVVLYERLNAKRQPLVDVNGRQNGFIWTEQLIPPIPELTQSARGLGPFPLPKVQESVYQFWAFKSSVGDAATLPAVALQIHALAAYEHWLQLLQQAGATGIADLPRHRDDLAHGTEVRKIMRTLRRAFMNDPSLSYRIEDFLFAEYKQEISVRERRLLRNLARLYQGRDHHYLNFYGPPGTITTIPYDAVITDSDPSIDQTALDFNDKIVFVGFSDLYDPGQPDRFYSVFSRSDGVDLSGIEIAATATANLLTDRTLKPIDASTTIEILLLFGGILGAGVYLLPALMGVPFALVLTILYVVCAQFAFNVPDVWLPLATPVLVQLPMALLIGLLGQYQLERRRQKQFSKAISYYLPKQAVKELTQKKLDPSALNKVVYGSCLATDMSGFTTISETMGPEELAMFMNSYFDTLAQALKGHKVDVTEFHADSIMCAWIAKQAGVRSRYNAAHAGLAVIDAINLFNEQAENVNLNARVGLDEGQFYLGHTGGGGRFGYSILGDCANTAARLESLNKQLGTHILATQPVVETATDLLVRPLGDFILFGKKDLTTIVEIVAWKTTANADQVTLCERFAEALDFFEQHQWAEAADHFEAILRDYPEDGPSRFYLTRCRYYQAEPPSLENPCQIRMLSK